MYWVKSVNNQDKSPISVRSIINLSRQTPWRLTGLRARPQHCFYWITRGQGRITLGCQTRGFGPNTLIFVPAGVVHKIQLGVNPLGYVAYLPAELSVPVAGGPRILKVPTVFEQGVVTGYFEQAAGENQSSKAGRNHAMESYLTLITVWIERNPHENTWPGRITLTQAHAHAESFLNQLERDLGRFHSVAHYAAGLDLTPTHLTRLSKQVLDQSAQDVILDRVILEARVLLADSALPIGRISATLGFSTPTYFSRMFNARTGMSPRQFRQLKPATSVPGAPKNTLKR